MTMISQEKSNPVLLVDDEEDIREVLGITMEDMGYDVKTAENGEKALELFKRFSFPIVLTDIKMPGMDGIELLKKIKTESPYTELIMITGHGDMNLAINSFRNDAVEFITKPVDIDSLNVAMGRAEEKIKIRKQLSDYTENLENLVFEKTVELKKVKESAPDKRKEESDINSVMDNLPLMIFFINRDFKITASNRLFKNKFGETYDFCYSALMLEAQPCNNCPALNCFESKESSQLEVSFRAGKEKNKTYLVWSSPLEDTDGKVTGAMIIATDINQIVDIQDHLTSLGLMVGSISHDIKGLLTGLDGGVYILDSAISKQDEDKTKEGLEMLKQTTHKIRKLILDILFFAKERELKKERIMAKKFFDDLVNVIKSRSEQNNIEIKNLLYEDKIEFFGDTGILYSAFLNILENAVDACINDNKTHHKISLNCIEKQGTVEFVISDNGIGMNKNEAENAFTLFHSTKGTKGTGLGLFISDKSIKQHKGKIRVTSEKSKGTDFVISLPSTEG
jgi:C4-dicarboxylate-specific signal transduction histidine kinase